MLPVIIFPAEQIVSAEQLPRQSTENNQ